MENFRIGFEELVDKIKGIPFTSPRKGKILCDVVRNCGYRSCLELGFAHGVSSVYIAAGLSANGAGLLVAVDNKSAEDRRPSIHDLIEWTGLSAYIAPVFHPLGYTWYLMEHIESGGDPFDFCFIDGSHSWDVDGFACLLISNLLRPGGLIIFDDLDWTYGSSEALGNSAFVKAMDERRRSTAQVRKVFEVLARNDPRFTCWEEDGWGYARRR